MRAAGGFAADASLRRLAISRIVPPAERGVSGPDRIQLDVPLAGNDVPEMPLEPGDEVEVLYLAEASRAFVDVAGAVYDNLALGGALIGQDTGRRSLNLYQGRGL